MWPCTQDSFSSRLRGRKPNLSKSISRQEEVFAISLRMSREARESILWNSHWRWRSVFLAAQCLSLGTSRIMKRMIQLDERVSRIGLRCITADREGFTLAI